MKDFSFEMSSDIRLIGYVKDYLSNKNISCNVDLLKDKCVVKLTTIDYDFKLLVANIMVWFFKYNLLIEKTQMSNRPSLAECAYLGAVLGLEKNIEINKIIKIADKIEIKNLDGFYNFCLCSMQENWLNLGLLSKKLLNQCKNEEDLLSLTSFMLGIDDGDKNNIIVDYPQVFLGSSEKSIDYINYFADQEKNVILAILAQNPSDILVIDSQKVSKRFMNVIKSLGE